MTSPAPDLSAVLERIALIESRLDLLERGTVKVDWAVAGNNAGLVFCEPGPSVETPSKA